MSLDFRPLPRSLPNPAYLQRLRERAMVRMRRDELDASQVTRRWSLQRFGLLLAAAGLMRSASAAGRRAPAPQYGVPGLPGNPPAPTPTSFATREDLVSLKAWNTSYSTVVGRPVNGWDRGIKSRTTYYRLPSGQLLILSLVSIGGTSYFVPGAKAFYVSFGSDLLGATLSSTELTLTPSLLKMPTTSGGDAAAIQRFAAQMDDIALAAANPRQVHIPVIHDASPNTLDTYPYITNINLDGDILKIACMSSSGTLYFDLKEKKFIRSVDGGKWYGKVP